MAYSGQLNSNAIFSAIYNMIISQQVFADNIKGTYGELVELCKVDGTLHGDTKLYYATDVLKSAPWGNDAEAANLLALHRPPAPKVQAITLNQFRQIAVTVDDYLSKQAFKEEGSFGQFNSVMLGWLGDTKRVYESRLFNTFVGTVKATATTQNLSISAQEVSDAGTLGQAVGEKIANLITALQDTSRDFNDDKLLRSHSVEDLIFIWNAKYVNKIKKIDMPVLFHKEGLVEKMDKYVLPAEYFGVKNGVAKTSADAHTRSLVEADVEVSGVTTHIFPRDLVPVGATLVDSGEIVIPSYQDNGEEVICKVIAKDSVPFMGAFSTGTSFFNPKSLTETQYLTWGYNELEALTSRPLITLTLVA